MSVIEFGEAFNEVKSCMEAFVNDMEAKVASIFDLMVECSCIENVWEPLYRASITLEESYNETCEEIKKEITNWSEEDGSYLAMAKKFLTGEATEELARNSQEDIVDMICAIKEQTEVEDNRPDFHETHFDTVLINEKMSEIYSKAQELEDVCNEHIICIRSLGEDNEVQKTIEVPAEIYGSGVKNMVQTSLKAINEFMSENIGEMNIKVDNAYESDRAESSKRASQGLEDTIAEMDQLLRSLGLA